MNDLIKTFKLTTVKGDTRIFVLDKVDQFIIKEGLLTIIDEDTMLLTKKVPADEEKQLHISFTSGNYADFNVSNEEAEKFVYALGKVTMAIDVSKTKPTPVHPEKDAF